MFDTLGIVLSLRSENPDEIKIRGKAIELAILLSCTVLSKPDRAERDALLEEIRVKLREEADGETIPSLENIVSQFDPSFSINDLSSKDREIFFNRTWVYFIDWADDDKSTAALMLDKIPNEERLSTLQTFARSSINHFRTLVDGIIHTPEGTVPQIESNNSKPSGKET